MGIAAYDRASSVIRARIDADKRPVEFEIMDRLNALEKYEDAGTPRTDVRISEGHGVWWIYCPKTGFGYWYKTLHEAMKRWRVYVYGYENGEWLARPIEREVAR